MITAYIVTIRVRFPLIAAVDVLLGVGVVITSAVLLLDSTCYSKPLPVS
jgi:hypothetical protein